ncbi:MULTISPECIES: oligoendopeptidase F [unclassified Fusibacter]|uniref:oligoendopeptidase F n=1 Tax=unclassified Fusibacter TaxID=2624464 RepID=UPI0010131863|nr:MULTISPECIES: oligoendopeptidase F [unclassified Fusibacter]MCK8061016.1 oligoendopeptidase F [Fusibacter sp. A2]NPE20530.1 oligoendopeptidase F [Fusibacter sp. A1]RXV63728.1 oligoendopeptidase F [Fusibacter sp. A1]
MKNRNDVNESLKWSIDEMFTEASFDALIKTVKVQIKELTTYKGKLSLDGDILSVVLKLRDELELNLADLFTYSHMKLDENTKNTTSQTRFERASAVAIEAAAAVSFIEPELLGLDAAGLLEKVKSETALSDYDHMIDNLIRQQEHVLTPEAEQLIAMFGDVQGAAQAIFGMLDNADITYEDVTMPNGDIEPLTKGGYIKFMEDADQEVRKAAFVNFYKSYEALKNTIASTYTSSVKKDIALSKIRGYDSAVQMSLDSDNIEVAVYDNLVAAINEKVDLMHRYVGLRKKMLGVEELHIYDVYAPLVAEAKREIPFDEAYEMVLEGLKPLGREYEKLLLEARDNRWIDVYETEGKRGGAYSWGTYRSKPYILLNYQNNLNDVFTLAHELGHSLHSHFSNKAQPSVKSGYSLFVAEVASTVNEAIMMRYLLEHTTEREERLFLLNHFMEQFKGTVFRQTMFAEFEKKAYEAFEQDNPLSVDDLSKMYFDLNKTYFGPEMILDDAIKYEWMRIPHFYNAFYVYKYATGFSAAMAISKRILDGTEGALEGYFEFLKSGGSVYPLDALKLAGVDMSEPGAIIEALSVFDEVLDEFEALV